ncbi:MAG TPA: regulatory protein RecX, partial [Chitinophagaceae bacterium]|nr:regulatory protein RecX [Chitinophagaceae bacterium]
QERCHSEVKTKAYSLGLRKVEVEELTSKLIEEGCLNEERFAKLYAGGKFRIKKWGRIKIKSGLKQKGVSEYCIRLAMKEINETEYLSALNRMARKRWDDIKGRGINLFVKLTKTRSYLLSKGYEPELVSRALKELQ